MCAGQTVSTTGMSGGREEVEGCITCCTYGLQQHYMTVPRHSQQSGITGVRLRVHPSSRSSKSGQTRARRREAAVAFVKHRLNPSPFVVCSPVTCTANRNTHRICVRCRTSRPVRQCIRDAARAGASEDVSVSSPPCSHPSEARHARCDALCTTRAVSAPLLSLRVMPCWTVRCCVCTTAH